MVDTFGSNWNTGGTSSTVSVVVVFVSTFSLSQGSGTMGTVATKSTTNRLWLAHESIGTLLASSKGSSLSSELVHADSWEGGSSVVLSLVLVNLVDWDGGVDDGWLDSLLLDNWLNCLVDVVVNVLTSNGGTLGGSVLGLSYSSGVLELSLLSGETLLDVSIVSVLDVAVLNTSELVRVLLWHNLLVVDRLN